MKFPLFLIFTIAILGIYHNAVLGQTNAPEEPTPVISTTPNDYPTSFPTIDETNTPTSAPVDLSTPTATPSSSATPAITQEVSSTTLPSPVPIFPNCQNPSDIDCSGKVTITDLSLLISSMRTNTNPSADIDHSGKINVLDLSILLANFGKSK